MISLAFMIRIPTSLASASGLADLIAKQAHGLGHILVIPACRPTASLLHLAADHLDTMISKMRMMYQILAETSIAQHAGQASQTSIRTTR